MEIKYKPYVDFYVPHNKKEFATYLTNHFPVTPLNKWMKLSKHRLTEIYMAIRTRRG